MLLNPEKLTSVIKKFTSVIKLYHRLIIRTFVSFKPNNVTYISANRAAKICMSRDLTKHIVNRAEAALKFTRHPKSASGMFKSVILLTR